MRILFVLLVLTACNNAEPKRELGDTTMNAEIRYKNGDIIYSYDTTDNPIVKVDTVVSDGDTIIRRYYINKSK